MKSFYQAYQAYERRAVRGEFFATRSKGLQRTSVPHEPFLAQFGDLLVRLGLKLKRRYTTGKPMAWLPLTGSKP